MASAISMRSLMRPTLPRAARIQSSIVTSTALYATKAPAQAKGKPSTPSWKNSNKGGGVKVKKPSPGERKAFRKRIQLSNNSALAVPGLDKLEADTMVQVSSAGKIFAIPDQLVDQLRALEAFRPSQSWNLFRSPHLLLRDEVVDLLSKLDAAGKKKETLKAVVTGSKLSGKSLALLQAMAHALMNNWVVINIPEAQDLTNGNTEYSPVSETEPIQFSQPVYVLKLLQNILSANAAVLEGIKTEKEWPRLASVKKGDSLAELIRSTKEAEFAWPAFTALWEELMLPGRPPVLFTLDGLSHMNKISDYRDPSFKPVHAHDFVLIGTFVDVLSGRKPMPNGGAAIAATSGNNFTRHPSQDLALAQIEAGQAGRKVPGPDPYERKYDERVYDALKNSYVLRLEGVKQEDARALMGYWGASGMMRAVINSQTVKEKWALGGHGIVGEMERTALMTLRV